MYVIKTHWYKMPAYYVSSEFDDNGNITIKNLTGDISKATIYDDTEDAEECCRSINDPLFKVYPVCPKCNLDYDGHPAISRHNNKILICSDCGIKEHWKYSYKTKKTKVFFFRLLFQLFIFLCFR